MFDLTFDLSSHMLSLFSPAEFSRPVSAMCENHDDLSHRGLGGQRRLHSPSVDEQETELEPSLEQEEEDKDPERDQERGQDHDYEGSVSPSRKKEIMVIQTPGTLHIQGWLGFS